jgi:hypothetical protein
MAILSGLEVHRRSGYREGINKNEYYAGLIRTVRRTLGLEVDMDVVGDWGESAVAIAVGQLCCQITFSSPSSPLPTLRPPFGSHVCPRTS